MPRDYNFKLNRKLKQLARRSAFASKAQAGEIMVVDNIAFDAPKTKNMAAVMHSLKIDNKRCLIILPEADKNVYLSARNLPKVKVTTVSELNTYSILDCAVLMFTEATLAGIQQHFNA